MENNKLNLMRLMKIVYRLINRKNKLVTERMETIEKLHNSIDFNSLTYYKCYIANINYDDFIDTATFFKKRNSNGIKLVDDKKNK